MDTRTVGILGGGQLGRMLVEAANRRNVSVAVLDKANSPAKQINATNQGVEGSFTDPQAIRDLAGKCDILTIEIEHVDTRVLEQMEKEANANGKPIEIQPHWRTIRTIQDKYEQKRLLKENDIDVAESIAAPDSLNTMIQKVSEKLGLPFMLKARTGAYDGRGNFPVRSKSDLVPAFETLKGRRLYAEKWVDFRMELAVMVVKTMNEANADEWETSTLAYPVVETVHQDSICKLVYAPARKVTASTRSRAENLARRAIAGFKGKGIFGVEMFLLKDDSILVNEIAPRPHNSGHYTIEACQFSQYDAHLHSILGWPIPPRNLRLLRPAVMLNILGGSDPKSFLKLAKIANAVGANVHLYSKGDASKGRKMGHLTVLGDSMEEVEDIIAPLVKIADDVRAGTVTETYEMPKSPRPRPLVGIISGSISDKPQLEICYKILEEFGIPYERGVKSAHRTPDAMAEYGKTAANRGLKVIIAAAGKSSFQSCFLLPQNAFTEQLSHLGGAAHLPGMVAAFAKTVPVIGLPIKPSIGDGMDSLLSITNLPRGE